MKVMGIEFASNKMQYVLIEMEAGEVKVLQANRLTLGETRSRDALVAFQAAISALFNATEPDLVGIKQKPESGPMQAGAAAIKMEGIVLASSPCAVDFVSGARINGCAAEPPKLFEYLQPAFKAAHAALTKKLK